MEQRPEIYSKYREYTKKMKPTAFHVSERKYIPTFLIRFIEILVATLCALDLFYGADYERGNGACVVLF